MSFVLIIHHIFVKIYAYIIGESAMHQIVKSPDINANVDSGSTAYKQCDNYNLK